MDQTGLHDSYHELFGRHTGALTSYLANTLASLKHENGAAVCVLHGNHGLERVVNLFC